MCIHVYTCAYMYTYVGHIQATYTLLFVGAHNRPKTYPMGGGNQRAPLRTAMGSSPATLSRDQRPVPRPVLARPCALHASGRGEAAPLRRPWALHAQWLHGDPILSPVGADLGRWRCAQESRAAAAAHPNPFVTLIVEGMYVYVCVCIGMYVHVCVCIACICIHVHTCCYLVASFEINPYVHVLHVFAYMCIHVATLL